MLMPQLEAKMKGVSQDSPCDQCMDSPEAFTKPGLEFMISELLQLLQITSSKHFPHDGPGTLSLRCIKGHMLSGEEVEP